MNENIERKVDMLISGMKLPKKKTRSRVATIATSLLIAIAIIASASLIGFYVQIDGEVTVDDLLTIDGDPAVEATITEASVNVVPGCSINASTHSIALNSNYDATSHFSVFFHIEVTEDGEVIENGLGPNSGGLLVEVWNSGSTDQITLAPGTATTFTIRVTADEAINSTRTYGYTITMDWNTP